MKKFSIHESDVNPWVVSKYGTYFSVFCCFKNYFSTLKINEYLDIDEATIASFTMISNTRTENNSANMRSDEDYQHFLIDDESSAFDTPTLLKNTNATESYKMNYELYTMYSQLLHKYPLGTMNRYFFQCMVDEYSSRILEDVLNNPINLGTGKDFEHSLIEDRSSAFGTPTLPRNISTSESFINNTGLYNHYYQLLQKYPPDALDQYYFQNFVDKYCSRIVDDIPNSSINYQSNPNASFNTPRISYGFHSFINRVEDEEDQCE
ncbi:hypothetical protein BB558_003087 [Smittium angustum]|uniref:Uncharacterized protein n=1 Tax=Smittium angustum TaxID=133377 RepID=A0A2U1J6Z9_SMIAN|nr:hypothetical protein BB558_003087 [Smittium angustum]